MICHACLAYSTNRQNIDGFDAWLCDKCGSTFTISQAKAAPAFRPHPNAIAIGDEAQLTNENMKQVLKGFKANEHSGLFVQRIEGGIDTEQGRVNIMSKDGRRIFFARFGWVQDRIIDNQVTKYRYEACKD